MFTLLVYGGAIVSLAALNCDDFRQSKFKKLSHLSLIMAPILLINRCFNWMSRVTILGLICLSLVTFIIVAHSKQISLWVISLAGLSQFLAVVFNNGLMPVDGMAIKSLYGGIVTDLDPGYVIINAKTKLPWLADIFYFPYAGGVFSVGDVLLAVGLWLIFFEYLRFRREQRRVSIITA